MAEWAAGQTILNEYTVEKELGRGGMGRVWLVKSQSTGRRFAVKQTLVQDEKHRKAFLNELQTWIDLPEHPNIVPCRFFRTVGNEIAIFADFIDGGSLADWIAKRKLTSLEQILDVAIQFAWGLHAIHERGLIHQDVKPSNVLMTADGVPMITDFGLARARARGADGSFVSPALPAGQRSILVSFGGMTPAYASPEQRAGQPLSRKTDIWSWGVSVLDMFMGGVSCPHGGHIAAEVLMDLVENRQRDDNLPRMPGKVVEVLRKCFAGGPATPWANLDDAVQTLIECIESSAGARYRRKSCQSIHPHSRVTRYDHHKENVQWRDPREWLREAYIANGVDPAEAGNYQPPAAVSRKGTGVALLATYEEAERQFERVIRNGRAQDEQSFAALLHDKTLLCMALEDATGALAACDRCIVMYERLVERVGRSDLAHYLAVAYMTKASVLKSLGDLRGAVGMDDRAIAILDSVVVKEGRNEFRDVLAAVYINKAIAVAELGDLRGAVVLCDRCIAMYERLVEREGRGELANELAGAYMNKALTVQSLGDLRGALVLYDRCITVWERVVEKEERGECADVLALPYMNKANALSDLGDLRGAVSQYDQCITIYERLVNEEGRREFANSLALAYLNRATAVADLGDLRGAVGLYDRCIAIYERLVEKEGRRELAPQLATAYMDKAHTLQSLDDPHGAAGLFDRCIAVYERLVEREGRGDLAEHLALSYLNKGNAMRELGDLRGAVGLYDRCIAIREKLVQREGRSELAHKLASAYVNKAIVVTELGDPRGAVGLYDRCIAIRERLVEREGQGELAGNLVFQLLRAECIMKTGRVSDEEVARTQRTFTLLLREVQLTGRSDLLDVVKWARETLKDLL